MSSQHPLPWRLLVSSAALLVLAAAPALAPLLELAANPSGWLAWAEADRVLNLARTSILVCTLTLLLALPIGTLLGVLLARTDVPGRPLWTILLLLTLFLPAPLIAAGWQMLWTTLQLPVAASVSAKLLAAATLNAAIALPWIALITGIGFRSVEPELEEEALLLAPPWRVFRRVTLARCRAAVGLAAFWVALLTWQEITITDLFQVRTFAEEVYQQFSSGRDELARAVAIAVPVTGLMVLATTGALLGLRQLTPERYRLLRPSLVFPLHRARWCATVFVAMVVAIALGGPIIGLIAKAGLKYGTAQQPGPPIWSVNVLLDRLAQQFQGKAWLLTESTAQALVVGLLASIVALWLLFLMRERPRLEIIGLLLAALLIALPGPLLGLGLLVYIEKLIQLPGLRWLGPLLYDRPSPLPVIWVQVLRFGPLATLMLWPSVRLIPRAHDEDAWLNQAGTLRRFALVYFRPLLGSLLAVALAIGTLALGELSASKLVATPGQQFEPLAHHLFQLMHASADSELAALSLCLLALVLATYSGCLLMIRHSERR